MYLADYHTHSKYSFDGCEELEDMCRAAIKAGLSEIAITDHVDIYRGLPAGHMKDFDIPQDQPPYQFGTPADPMFADKAAEEAERAPFDKPAEEVCDDADSRLGKLSFESQGREKPYRIEVPGGSMDMLYGRLWVMELDRLYMDIYKLKAKYAGRLKVKAGAELGQPNVNPRAAEKFLRDYPLDFVIGSIHNMDFDLDVFYYDLGKLDCGAVYDRYLDYLIDMAEHSDFDIMGHITYPLRYMFERNELTLDLKPYTEKLRYLFSVLEYSGRGIELNVSGMSKKMKDTMPPMDILKMYRECHGELITIGSDAHTKDHIGDYQKEAQYMLQTAGFRYITTFERRKAEFIKLS